jgi:ABC-2 type transport system ATP-binding protein
MPLFQAVDVSKQYATQLALDHVSISVPEKCIFGLLGPNGAGKTTLIRIINQITGPDTGELLLNGKRLTAADVQAIGYLPEERGLYKKMKVGEQALYLAQLKGLSKAEAMRRLRYWFKKLEIVDWWGKKVEELSKGMQQKVQFITTVLHEPKLLIFDEPFTGFDPVNANLVKNEILFLRERGATIIFSTHNMSSVEELCDNITLINKGRSILEGSVDEIRRKWAGNGYDLVYEGTTNSGAKKGNP